MRRFFQFNLLIINFFIPIFLHIFGNIKQIFAKYIEEGKATIMRLKELPLELAVKLDVILFKSFLHNLKLAFEKKLYSASLKLLIWKQLPLKIYKQYLNNYNKLTYVLHSDIQ